jgi:hypothetical protein
LCTRGFVLSGIKELLTLENAELGKPVTRMSWQDKNDSNAHQVLS